MRSPPHPALGTAQAWLIPLGREFLAPVVHQPVTACARLFCGDSFALISLETADVARGCLLSVAIVPVGQKLLLLKEGGVVI